MAFLFTISSRSPLAGTPIDRPSPWGIALSPTASSTGRRMVSLICCSTSASPEGRWSACTCAEASMRSSPMLGTLKAGAVYVPLDAQSPAGRLRLHRRHMPCPGG